MSEVGKIFLSIGLVTLAAMLFVGTYLLNKHTKKPDGCEDIDCQGCSMISCSHHPQEKNIKEEGENKNE